AGADRDFFADRDKLEGLAATLTNATRAVVVRRDEEHNRYLLQIEDRSNGYARQQTIGVDFVASAEYRTLLANRRDFPRVEGELVVSGVEPPEETDQPTASSGGTAIGGAPADEATRLAAEPRERGAGPAGAKKTKAIDVRLASSEELVDFFIT